MYFFLAGTGGTLAWGPLVRKRYLDSGQERRNTTTRCNASRMHCCGRGVAEGRRRSRRKQEAGRERRRRSKRSLFLQPAKSPARWTQNRLLRNAGGQTNRGRGTDGEKREMKRGRMRREKRTMEDEETRFGGWRTGRGLGEGEGRRGETGERRRADQTALGRASASG